ncbi:uncharacterized protein LOC115373220 [Myripristis murdjan]|uniref:uncharacterized protein LOC115373220 n=1 Tax=Myripristis murdjan TaxID=586833 RepID=UPI00117630BE|nr:uncharacterized protein LOC115373220 [Myripristis murdjan]
MRELILLEEFKNCLPEKVVVYLNEQKVASLTAAAVLADEFALTHKSVFSPPGRRDSGPVDRRVKSPKSARRNQTAAPEARECFYCREPGHLIAACPVLKKKEQSKNAKGPTPVGLIQTRSDSVQPSNLSEKELIDSDFRPFVTQGFVSLVGEERKVPVTILRDTGAKQTIIRGGVLSFSEDSYCGADVLAWGVKMSAVRVPLHFVELSSRFVSGKFRIAVRPQLPIAGIDVILGNDLAGKKVFPAPEVTDDPIPSAGDSVSDELNSPPVFPVCAVTRAQAKKFKDCVDLSDSFMNGSEPVCQQSECESAGHSVCVELQPNDEGLKMSVDREQLIREQKNDVTLSSCFSLVNQKTSDQAVSYFLDDGVLMRTWTSGGTHEPVRQIVVPQSLRCQVLCLAHDHCLSGHLGIRKTYTRVLRYFFWPGLKSDVVKYCRSCHTCQKSGKPNQTIPAAPLKPIPVVGEPFEHVIVDCVGPLPKTKSGHQYILTVMCAATRFPEAIPLRSLKSCLRQSTGHLRFPSSSNAS